MFFCQETLQKQAEARKVAGEEEAAAQKRQLSHQVRWSHYHLHLFIHQALRAKGDVTVDVRAGLANIRLVHLHHAQMPDSKATDEIATWARNLHRKGVQAPFPFQVKLVLPKHCANCAFCVFW